VMCRATLPLPPKMRVVVDAIVVLILSGELDGGCYGLVASWFVEGVSSLDIEAKLLRCHKFQTKRGTSDD
jgi:hypothetical protein